jgi:hypothetical protein
MKSQKIISREYKVMLRPDRFGGPEKQLLTAAREFWRDFARSTASVVLDADGTLKNIEKRRLVVFLDTGAQHLRDGGYIFRVRRALESGPPEVTLKFRHADRYVAESRRMKSRRGNTKEKFEEDIKAPFVSLYSFSVGGTVGRKGVPSNLGEVSRLFPDLAKRLGEIEGTHTVSAVKGFTASELVITGSSLRIGSSPKTVAECALIVWYDHSGSATEPVAVEFSYRYGDRGGRYGGRTARRAFDIFQAIQRDLLAWVDPTPRTKTAFVFG